MKRRPKVGETVYCVSLPLDNTGKPHVSGARPLKVGGTYKVKSLCNYHISPDHGAAPKRISIGTDWWTRPEHFISWPDEIDRRKSDAER